MSAANRRGKRSAQRPKGAEARGIAAEIGAKRRLQRKARSRSDAPRLIVAFGTPFTIFGTIGGILGIISGTAVVGNGCRVAIITGSTTIGAGARINAGIIGCVDGTSSSRRATR